MRARELPAGTVIDTRTGGGGGYGNPKARPLQEVQSDVLLGLVSREAAWTEYGVKLRAGFVGEQARNRAADVDLGASSCNRSQGTESLSSRLKGIGKSFGGIRVLSGVDLDVGQGEIHGLVGENGAGKSTLGKIIGGYYSASEGTLEVFGSRISTWSPKEALDRGIAIMHQELQLVPELTVAQNVFSASKAINGRSLEYGRGAHAAHCQGDRL